MTTAGPGRGTPTESAPVGDLPATAPTAARARVAAAGVTVDCDGRRVTDDESCRLVAARVAGRLNQPSQCELSFAVLAPAAALPAGTSALRPGAELRVCVPDRTGPASGEPAVLFDGEITCVEYETGADGTSLFRVRGYDRLHRVRRGQQLRVFEAVTAVELAEQLVRPAGLTVDAHARGPRLERVLQHRHSDLDLLLEVCGRAGLHTAVEGTTLHLVTLAGHGTPVDLVVGQNLLQVRVSVNADRVTDRSAALGWHSQRAALLTGSSDGTRGGPPESGEFDAGGLFGDRTRTLIDQPGRSDDELAALAQAGQDVAGASARTLRGVADGDPALSAGRRIELQGVPDGLDGRYVLTDVVHTVDGAGFLTSFGTEPPTAPVPAVGATATLGRVTAVDDPDRTGRVRVTLPTFGDLDAGWLAVASPGAGPGRGIVALPDVDDTVFVVLPHGEPTAGVVVGSLYGTVEPPDSSGVDGGRVRRWSMTTPTGQSIVVDDEHRALRLADATGSRLALSPDGVVLHGAGDLLIEAPGKRIRIRAAAIDFEEAP